MIVASANDMRTCRRFVAQQCHTGGRSGHTTLLLYAALAGLGLDVHRRRVREARATAEYAVKALRRIGVDARRHPHAFTVYFPPPPPELTTRWVIPADDRHGHIVCTPNITRTQIDALAADWQAIQRGRPAPRQRNRELATAAGPSG